MKLRHTLFLLLFSLTCAAQVDVHFPNAGDAVSQEWVKVYLQEWFSRLKPRTDTTTIPTDPTGPGNPCTTGPVLTSVFNAVSTELTFNFSGVAPTINWYILSGNTVVRNGSINPTSNIWQTVRFNALAAGTYKFKTDGANCTTTAAIEFTIVNDTPSCVGGPTIGSIISKSQTGLTFSWSGLNVPEVVWNIRQNNNNVRSGTFIPTASQTVNISFAQIPTGTYELQLIGISCPTIQPSVSFTLAQTPTPTPSTRHVYMNFTGYGFTNDDPTGMTVEHRERAEAFMNLNYNGNQFKGIDGIRVNMKWYEYEPTEGTFRDDKVIACINWCAARGIKLSFALIPWRREGDGMFDEHNKARLANGVKWSIEGDLPSTYRTYMPSMNSTIGYAKFKAAAKHLASVMSGYPNTVDYVSTATSDGEEYQMVREAGTFVVSGYAGIDEERWASYSGGLPVQRPAAYTEDAYNTLMGSSSGRKWYEYQTDALKNFHAAFVQGIREGAVNGIPRAAGMYAGIGAPTAVWDNTYKLNTIYSAGLPDQPSGIYSSEGDANALGNKLMATDMNLATFPGADPFIEFDPDDLNTAQIRNPPWDADLSSALLYNYSASFFRRGGKVVHFAMAFNPAKIPQLAEGLWKIKSEFLDSSSGMTGIEQGEMIVFPIMRYNGLQEYRFEWSNRGGGLNKQVKIKLE